MAESTPTISVVIAWVNPLDLLTPGLQALTRQPVQEIIVATRHNAKEQARLRALFPQITVLPAAPNTPITALRSLAIKHARSDVVAVTEDHCVPDENWIATIAHAQSRTDCDVVGGPVENALTTRWRDWAAFLTEYAGAIRSATGNESNHALPGNNVAYKRALLDGLCATLERGLWESFYHPQLIARGAHFKYDPRMIVYHRRPFDFTYFVFQRFQFSRSFAAMRLQSLTAFGRIKYGVGAVLLPPLLFLRGLMTLRRKQRFVGRYLACAPLIGAYVTVGALGEMLGYFLGGGDSLEKIE
ncbi:hypothetical protein ANRL1_02372 [Anaerolineae bacterium]|nr:hypothetical protein ANRL1_02372 [Anaerolineae bacterium]